MNATRVALSLFVLSTLMPLAAQGLHPTQGGPSTRLDGLRLTSMRVRAEVQDQVGTTELLQTFTNSGRRVREAIWLLPLPEGATADGFAMTVNGKRMESEVLDAAGARRVYEQIVRRRRDPGLLEYAGRGCLRARVYPIPPQGSVKVEVRYRQVLPYSAGLYRWSFPLRSTLAAGQVPERLSLDLQIAAGQPIRTLYTPHAGLEISRKGDHRARVSFELQGRAPSRDLEVFFGLEQRDFGLNLLSYRKGQEPGYFLMALAPKQDWPDDDEVQRAVQFVVDTSGSMAGKKIGQAKEALRYFVNSLGAKDWFNIISFSTEAGPLFDGVRPAGEKQSLEQALTWIDGLKSRGGTNIEDALRTAMAAELPKVAGDDLQVVPLTVFLTDGLPTVGNTDEDFLVALTDQENRLRQRVFVFGVGHDLNTRLLDRIAAQTRGSRDYVREDENIEVKTSALFDRLSHPVMTDVQLRCEDAGLERVHPRELPDLFQGDQLVVLGRYRSPGHHALRLSGTVAGGRREFVYESDFTEGDRSQDFVPALWGERRVAALLDAMRLNGSSQELVDEVTRLGREFAIVTPYTAHLVLEDDALGGAGIRVVDRAARPGSSGPAGPSSPGAVSRRPGPGSPATGRGSVRPESDDFFMGAGKESQSNRDLAKLLFNLKRAGALPAAADEKDLKAMLARVARELVEADRRLKKLDEQTKGREAVDGSRYLAEMFALSRRGTSGQAALASLLTRRAGEYSLRLQAGIWTDMKFTGQVKMKRLREIKAFTEEYFALLAKHPRLAPVFAFSSHVLVVVEGQPIRIVED